MILNKVLRYLKGDRKYFTIVFFVLVLLAGSGILTNILLEQTTEDWDKNLTAKISEIQNSVRTDFERKQTSILFIEKKLKQDLALSLRSGNETFRELIKLVNDELFDDYSIEIFAPNGKLIAWNSNVAIGQEELFPLNFPLGETYFYVSPLNTFLTIVDTCHLQQDIFFLAIALSIEKNYFLNNQYYNEVSFKEQISTEYQLDFEVDYNPYSTSTKDGRKYSFQILNNNQNKIGLVTFLKPSLSGSLTAIKELSSKIQSLLVLLIIILIGVGLKNDYKLIESKLLKFIIFLSYIAIARTVLFVLNVPSVFFDGPLTDPSNFSSVFAWGIVKSPIEFLTTNILIAFVGIQIFRYTNQYLFEEGKKKYLIYRVFYILFFAVIFFLLIRALSASVRSIIFDSTIRYFKEPDIIPNLVSVIMNVNLLLLGFTVVLALTGVLQLIAKFVKSDKKELTLNTFLISIYIITVVSILAFFISNDPLIPIIFLIVFLLLIYLLFYQVIFRSKIPIYNYVYILLAGSVISVTLLNYFNTKLERESLKTTAFELNRTDENFLRFMLVEVLQNAVADKEITNSFGMRNINFDALAFNIWSKSNLQRESMNSGIRFYDRSLNLLGGYLLGIDAGDQILKLANSLKNDEPEIIEINPSGRNKQKYYAGIVRISERGITKGYITAYVNFDISSIGSGSFPDFIESNLSILNKVIDIRQIKIFQFENKDLTQVYGEIYPSREQIKEILNHPIDKDFNEGWMKLNFGNETYEAYLLKIQQNDSEMLTVVATAEKAFSWNLFNFFKIFIVHTFLITLAFILILITRLNKVTLTFKSKLLFAFLFISVIPVIILALYNRDVVFESGRQGIFRELSQRANYIENHINTQIEKHKGRDLIQACQNAANELEISFSLYSGTDQIYNSQAIYNKLGFFDYKLNSQAHYYLNYLRYKEYITHEKVNNYTFDSYYRYIKIGDQDYILSVNDAFNKIKISFSTIELDVVIFGIYAFAVIIIIIISTIFANQISSPIQRLTKATESVGKGDLSVVIKHNERGELRDLLDGFNRMTTELKKNQIELAEMEREAAWKEMAKQVAHEIKNPLTPMKLAIQQLLISFKDKNKEFDTLFEKVTKTVLNQIDTLNQIASEFSRFAKMPSLKLEQVDLLTILQDTVNLYAHENTELKIKTNLSEAIIEADVSQLRRMFINLIRNSIQAEAKNIDIEILLKDKKYILEFTDNGIGINESDKERIFDENYSTKKQGMGLGLSITKRFLQSIDGEIYLKSSSPSGTTFTIEIPVLE